MKVQGLGSVAAAVRAGGALPAVTIYNLEGLRACIGAAQRTGTVVIIQVSPSFLPWLKSTLLGPQLAQIVSSAPAQLGLHLDHARELSDVATAIAWGFTSVMVDGSELPLEENIALVKDAATSAHRAGLAIEAELGPSLGPEDRLTELAVRSSLTDPSQAVAFVEATQVDALAVAIGNQHGQYRGPARLDFRRLRAIADQIDIPLVLHGASGLSSQALRRCVSLGVGKVNFNTELRRLHFQAFSQAAAQGQLDTLHAMEDAFHLMRAFVEGQIATLRGKQQ